MKIGGDVTCFFISSNVLCGKDSEFFHGGIEYPLGQRNDVHLSTAGFGKMIVCVVSLSPRYFIDHIEQSYKRIGQTLRKRNIDNDSDCDEVIDHGAWNYYNDAWISIP